MLLTETVLYYWNCIDLGIQASTNGNASGVRLKDWADKVVPSKFLSHHPNATNSRHAELISSSTTSGWNESKRNAEIRTYEINESDEEDSLGVAPLHKRSKISASGSLHLGSGVDKKYVKTDLPLGCMENNAWRRCFISALAHFAGGYHDPWSISSDEFNTVLQNIWNMVFGGKIQHTVILNGPVYQMAKQNLDAWRDGFAAAAVAVISAFFANHTGLTDPAARIDFSKVMLKKHRFLFSENRGTDPKAWTGLWRAPFVLQTFAHHFNFIQGRVGVAGVDKELAGPQTALALSCAAVCRMLTLVANNNIAFESGHSGTIWSAVIPKGDQYEFNEIVWGQSTRQYLEPIKQLSDSNFCLIVEATQCYVKEAVTSSDDEDSESSYRYDFR